MQPKFILLFILIASAAPPFYVQAGRKAIERPLACSILCGRQEVSLFGGRWEQGKPYDPDIVIGPPPPPPPPEPFCPECWVGPWIGG